MCLYSVITMITELIIVQLIMMTRRCMSAAHSNSIVAMATKSLPVSCILTWVTLNFLSLSAHKFETESCTMFIFIVNLLYLNTSSIRRGIIDKLWWLMVKLLLISCNAWILLKQKSLQTKQWQPPAKIIVWSQCKHQLKYIQRYRIFICHFPIPVNNRLLDQHLLVIWRHMFAMVMVYFG